MSQMSRVTNPHAVAVAWTDLMLALPDGSDFEWLRWFEVWDENGAAWEAQVTLPTEDRCPHVEGCAHRAERPEISGTGKTPEEALTKCAATVREWIARGEGESK